MIRRLVILAAAIAALILAINWWLANTIGELE